MELREKSSQEKMRAAEAPMKPKKGAVSSPLKVDMLPSCGVLSLASRADLGLLAAAFHRDQTEH